MTTETRPIIVEHFYPTPIEKVWNAITDVKQMRLWFFENIPAFEPKVGFTTLFDVDAGERIFRHIWKIIDVIPMKKIVYRWSYGSYPGESFVTFELTKENDRTHLQLTHKGIENFPQEIPEFSQESCKAGWIYFINNRLKEYIENR